MTDTKEWYEQSYDAAGFGAQRKYPNEEMLRFFGRHFFFMSRETRADIRVLEVGSGSGANLWMIAREGFDAHGVELSESGNQLCRTMLEHWGARATLKSANMLDAGYPDAHFDAIIDVFSTYCLVEGQFETFLDEVTRMLKPGGRYFSYAPSQKSEAFTRPGSSRHLDASTLDGIRRTDAPFAGNLYPFRFVDAEQYRAALVQRGLGVPYLERVGRTYRDGAEYFEFVVIEAEKSCA